MEGRVFGIETEFGCLVHDPEAGTPEEVVERIKDHAFLQKKLGVIDLHARNYAFEPARSGGFLTNGARLYVDAVGSHEEYATPECSGIFDVVTWDKAGHRLLQEVINDLELQGAVSLHNNSVDHFGGHTFGCHENYLVRAEDLYFSDALLSLLPFLVTRQIYAGAGRVGGHRLNYTDLRRNVMTLGEHEVDYMWIRDFYGVEIDRGVDYQLSQRADHIVNLVSSRVRFNRALINPRRDSYYDFSGMQRLHLLFGEANMSEYAMALKVGATCLALRLMEMRALPRSVRLADPLEALRSVSRDPSWKWLVDRQDGTPIPAIEVQRSYLDAARACLAGQDEETDWVLREWEDVLDLLEKDPMSLSDRLDWVAKRKLMETFIAEEGARWGDDVLHSLDLEYHNINRESGLYYALEEQGGVRRVTTDAAIERATRAAPRNTRAWGRSHVIRELIQRRVRRYAVDWDSVYVDQSRRLELRDPFRPYKQEAARFVRRML
ncbi:MAG: proteasome accessory factor PafA2 family protein [Armatimonadetes bacterium]|nr:proteasome accessory factor PafA2 family protein [Armatimonadota bacterium]